MITGEILIIYKSKVNKLKMLITSSEHDRIVIAPDSHNSFN